MKKFFSFIIVLLMLSISHMGVYAQQYSVSGNVLDSAGAPLAGVSIAVKGTSSGTTTNVDGEFSLKLQTSNPTLIVSYLGMKTQEIAIGSKTYVDIVMEQDVHELNELVVVGYGTMRKSDLTGSVASVNVESMLEAQSSSTFETMLQGRVAGVQIVNSNNDSPSGGATVRIRGMSSISGGNSPLVVVDGIPIGDAGSMNSISPSIIKSIEVLKDASSTAIYGSKGANGVIMITTKTGDSDKRFGVYFNTKLTLGDFSKKLDYWRDPVEMIEISNESRINAGLDILYNGSVDSSGVYYPSLEEVTSGAWPYWTVWEDYIYRDVSVTQEYSVGVEGSNENGSYRVNATYYDGEGMRIGDDYNKFMLDLNYNNKINKFMNLTTRAGMFKDYKNNIAPGGHGRNPLFPVYEGDGTPYKTTATDYGNPVGTRENLTNYTDGLSGYATLQLDVDILKSLKFVARADMRASNSSSHVFNPETWSLQGDSWNNRAVLTESFTMNFKSDAFLTYTDTFKDYHNVSVMVGGAMEETNSRYLEGTGYSFASTTLEDQKLNTAEELGVNNGTSREALLSGFMRFNYNYKNRYYATFTARADGSSKFGANNKWAYFPSGAVSWRLSEEEFIKDLNLFDNLKLRASYGVSGNQGISAYQTNTIYGWSWVGVDGEDFMAYGPGVSVGREGLGDRYVTWGGIGNQSLRWELTSQLDLGLDLSMFNSRLNLTFDIYKKRTTDLLREQFIAPNTGFDKMWTNDGEIVNKGFDFSIDGDIIRNNDWTFNAGAIFSLNRNEVVSLGNDTASGLITDANGVKYEAFQDSSNFSASYVSILALGQPVGVFYGYKVDGIIQNSIGTDKMTQAGELNYVGLQEDGSLDTDARTIIGDPNPDFSGSINLSLTHKSGFDLSAQFYGVYGNDVIAMSKLNNTDLQSERWTYENPSTTRPSLRADRTYEFSDWFLEDGSFLRLQNLTVGYTFTKKNPILDNARIYLTGTNLFTLTKCTLPDPETDIYGITQTSYPRVMTFTLGIQANF